MLPRHAPLSTGYAFSTQFSFCGSWFYAALLAVILNLAGIVSAHALDMTGIRFGVHGDRERAVIELSQKADFRAFVMSGPDRVVVDMAAFRWKIGTIPQVQGSLVKDVRYGPLGAGRGRLVIETKGPVLIKSAFTIPRGQGQADRLVIDFAATSAATMKEAGNQILGTLPATAPTASARMNAQSQAQRPPAQTTAPKAAGRKLVIIDPGHGGQDPGAIGANGMYEKTIVLAVGLELKNQLEAAGYRVKMTRESDVFLKLHDRVKFARQNKADLFISLHADSIRDAKVTGASVYTLSDKASDKESEKLAERENKADLIAGIDLSHQEDDVAGILIDLAARDTMNQSHFLATRVLTNFSGNSIKTIDGTPKSAGFAVLKALDIPSILVEMGYLTNRAEVERLSSAAHRRKIAAALKSSIDQYFQKTSR